MDTYQGFWRQGELILGTKKGEVRWTGKRGVIYTWRTLNEAGKKEQICSDCDLWSQS